MTKKRERKLHLQVNITLIMANQITHIKKEPIIQGRFQG